MQEQSLFIAALEKEDAVERAAFLDQACAGEPELRQRLDRLLEQHRRAGGFLETPAVPCVAAAIEALAGNGDTEPPEGEPDDQALDFLTPADQPDVLGRLGHYQVLEVVGKGGMGIVLRAFDEKLRRVVAIKVMPPALAANATARKRFVREARAAAAVRNDYVIGIHTVEEASVPPYLVMEFISGQSLQERLDQAGALGLKEILRIGMQTALGLAAAHQQGLIHRDVKPANILLENGVERVKITDFGMARAAADASLTQSGVVAGTPQYMSPEQARGEPVDARTDLFSLGSVLYAMGTGRVPFRASGSLAVLKRVCEETPTPIREVNPEVPDWLVAIIDKLHAKDPAERFQSAAEVAELLGRHLAQVQQPTVVEPASGGRQPPVGTGVSLATGGLRPPLAKRRWAVAAAVVLLLLGGLSLTEAAGVTNLRATVIRIFTPDGTLVVEVDDPGVKVTIEGDGGLVITGAGPQEVRVRPGKYTVRASKDGKPLKEELVSILRGGKEIVRVQREPLVSAAQKGDARQVLVPRAILQGHTSWVQSLAFSPDGKTLATGSNDQRVRFWDTATGDQTGQFHADAGLINWLAYSPNGAVLVTGGNTSNVRVWDAATFKRLAEVKHGSRDVSAVAFRRGGSLLATASADKTVKLWKWDGKALVHFRTLAEHSSGVGAMSFNPQGSVIASATGDGVLYLWDVDSGELLKSVRLGWQPLACLAFSPDGHTIAAGGRDKRVELRKADTLESVGTLRGHQEWVCSLAFLPDGKTLVSAGMHVDWQTQKSNRPGELKLWDVARLQERLSVDGYESAILSLALSPDGKTLATGDFANLVRLWDVDALLAAARVRETASAGATPERGAFVLLAGKDVAERKFDTLAEAVQGASDGDTIEIRGNGPFVTESVSSNSALTVRAGEGFRPVIKLSAKAAQSDLPLFKTRGRLVLEGLDLFRPKGLTPGNLVESLGFVAAANCRFHVEGGNRIWTADSCTTRNCLFLGSHLSINGSIPDGAKYAMHNCVDIGRPINLPYHRDGLHIRIELTQNTIVARSIGIQVGKITDPLSGAKSPKPIRVDAFGNIFGTDLLWFQLTSDFLAKHKGFEPEKSGEALLRSLMDWNERENLHAPGRASLSWVMDQALQPSKHVRTFAEWQQFWGLAGTGSLEGVAKYQGGDVLAKFATDPDRLTPDDFRLRPDSAGYRAGKDGKDLGADVDLVGPGPAYERWKQTPEYQQWLKDTGQFKAEAPKPEAMAFALMGGTGVAERKFDTLAEAVQNASDGDTIEIRGNGPFVTPPINIKKTALTVRAADGFRPVIKLSPEADQADVPLLGTNAALVLEGLELYRAPREDGSGRVLEANRGPLRAVNCRFRSSMGVNYAPVCVFRNCEFLAKNASVVAMCGPGARVIFENCLHRTTGFAIGIGSFDVGLHDVSIQIKGSTLVSKDTSFWLPLRSPLPSDPPQASKPVGLEVAGSILSARTVLGFDTVQGFDQERKLREKAALLEPPEAEAGLLRLLAWQGERNLFAADSTCVRWSADGKQQPPHGPKSLEEWKRFWGAAETGSLEGTLRFQGGDLLSRTGTALDQLTPDDFRLRPDSAGFRAGKDGKDLGADVDLVGPGPAYERWKKTPEYQQWLKDTGQSSGQ